MGCGNFPCLIIKAFYGLLQSPGKEGQKRKVGEAAWSIKASRWKPDLQSSWGMVEFVNLPKQESACPSPGGLEALKLEADTQQL